jgi:hypothetical protein
MTVQGKVIDYFYDNVIIFAIKKETHGRGVGMPGASGEVLPGTLE